MGNPLVTGIISITIGAIMLANVFMSTIKATNTSTWSASEVARTKTKGFVPTVMGSFRSCRSCWLGLWNFRSIRFSLDKLYFDNDISRGLSS